MGRPRLVLLAFFCAAACGGTPTTPSLDGAWGGEHIALTLSASGSHAELDCAHGDFAGVPSSNSFSVIGTFVREHGGPIAIGELPDTHPALYVGSLVDATMTLAIRLTDTNDLIGTFTLTRGAPGRVVKCL